MSKGKVKVTKAQAEAIDYFKKTFVQNRATSMSNEKLVSALNYGYEIIPEFKVGDWVKHKSYSTPEKIVKQNDDSIETETLIDNIKAFKQATTEEIKQEKERRWWMKIGREINEYKNGDIVSTGSITRKINYLFENGELGLEGMDYGYKPNELILVCPTENRLDTQ